MTATNSFSQRWSGGGRIIDVVDEILVKAPKATGLAIHWQLFGSNGQEKADYSKGVLERFTRRAPKNFTRENKPENIHIPDNCYVKVIGNPRKINLFRTPHRAEYFLTCYSVDENLRYADVRPAVVADKIVINHYHCKSREEYSRKRERGDAVNFRSAASYNDRKFSVGDRNEEFDDSILKYRAERAKIYQPPDKSHTDERLLNALERNLSPTLSSDTPPEFYTDKIETFLTCRAVSSYLQTKFANNSQKLFDEPLFTAILESLDQMTLQDAQLLIRDLPNFLTLPDSAVKVIRNEVFRRQAKFYEEVSLVAILKSLEQMTIPDMQLLIRDLPNLMSLPYPVIKELRDEILKFVPKIMEELTLMGGDSLRFREFIEMDYIQDWLKLI